MNKQTLKCVDALKAAKAKLEHMRADSAAAVTNLQRRSFSGELCKTELATAREVLQDIDDDLSAADDVIKLKEFDARTAIERENGERVSALQGQIQEQSALWETARELAVEAILKAGLAMEQAGQRLPSLSAEDKQRNNALHLVADMIAFASPRGAGTVQLCGTIHFQEIFNRVMAKRTPPKNFKEKIEELKKEETFLQTPEAVQKTLAELAQ